MSARETSDGLSVAFRDDGAARLDRDVVVRWPVGTPTPGVALDRARPRRTGELAYGLLTITPPSRRTTPVPRDVIVLIDTSGSMYGAPLEQSKRLVSALVDELTDRDRLELIQFSWKPRRWNKKAVLATDRHKKSALGWIQKLDADGGTEMRDGIYEALAGLRDDAQRQVVLVTDGLIGFESEIVSEIRHRLPQSSRVHTVGVGSGVNRSLTAAAARAGAGVEVIVAPDEDVEPAVKRLLARTSDPAVVDVEVSGSALCEHAAGRLPDLFAGAPARIPVSLSPEGGELRLRGRTPAGRWEERVTVQPTAEGHGSAAVAALFARESVEELEMKLSSGENPGAIDRAIVDLGLRFQIATRLTSWVAVSDEPTVDPTEPARRERMPHELPYGMSIERLGLRSAAPMRSLGYAGTAVGGRLSPPPPAAAPAPPPALGAPPPHPKPGMRARAESSATRTGTLPRRKARLIDRVTDFFSRDEDAPEDAEAEEEYVAFESKADAARATLTGRLVLESDERIVIEVTLPLGGEWDAGDEVLLLLDDGRQVRARVDIDRTTAPGSLEAGQIARVTLELDAPLGARVRSVVLNDEEIVVDR